MNNEKFNSDQDEVYSKAVKAGKRTYFIDVKATKGNDHYITITESKKMVIDGRESFQKHKIFLYKEDFEKVFEGLEEVIAKANELNGGASFSDKLENEVEFEDL